MSELTGSLGVLGLKIITSKHMTERETYNRSWKERLLTLPWRPFQKTKTIQIPMQAVMVDQERGIVYCHPAMLGHIIALLEASDD